MHSHRNASFSYPSPLLTSRGLCLSSSNCCLLVSVVEVTELKSLANHVVVGSVSCEMLDLFCPLPQTLAVDINDLGTVKLNLEVTWRYLNLQPFCFCNVTISTFLFSRLLLCFSLFFSCFSSFFSPFDKDDQTSSTSTVSKRLLSNQSPPDTPSMREQVFYVSHIKRDIHQHIPLSTTPSHILYHSTT